MLLSIMAAEVESATVLVVGTEASERQTLTNLLRSAGLEIVKSQAVGLASDRAEQQPDVIVLIQSAGADGTVLQQRVLASAATSEILVIIVSAESENAHTRTNAFRSGAVDCISQRTPREELVAKVKAWAKEALSYA